ncbi:MAG: hypothetical protein A7316_06260 [Candidatus Altiarchaeales archaeon WOR_SM1_86-2]|nr:MAG: hypothetical protein A7316_06260 [Candidatus Altiarchaeales archaeon WOR_SM1_86-2]ODS40416.1 MAG: hypothetical protein A7315_08565 [Candidatus Altiarchaeales archaeon WOR_SM1_79]
MVKKKILIKGGKVHDVGYRPFLLEKAQELCIPRYYAKNIKENSEEIIEVSLDGEEDQITEFIEFVNNNYPPKAVVSETKEDPNPPKRIMPIDSYVHLLHTGQLGKIAQAGLGMLDKQDQMLGKQDQMLDKQDETIETLGGKIDNLDKNLGDKIDNLTDTTQNNFNTLNTKYDVLSQNTDKILAELVKERKELRRSIEKLVNAILQSK